MGLLPRRSVDSRRGVFDHLIREKCPWPDSNKRHTATGLGYAFGVLMAATAVYDLATVKKTVHRRNEVRLARRKLKVAVTPFALPRGAGVQVQLSF